MHRACQFILFKSIFSCCFATICTPLHYCIIPLMQMNLLHHRHGRFSLSSTANFLRLVHVRSSQKGLRSPPPPPPPPVPPRPPEKSVQQTHHGVTWYDSYSWMSDLGNEASMRHMDICMEQEQKYTEAVMSDTDRLQRKLLKEMAGRMASPLCTPPVRWGPWLYYRRVEEGKQYPVLCRRSASLNEEFISYNEPSAGFDFTSGKRIEQKLVDYNQEAERFGGYAYEELSEVSPDHHLLAYTMYDKDNDYFVLSVRDLFTGSLYDKPRAERVASLAWAMNGEALIYAVTDSNKRPYRIFCSVIGSNKEDILIMEEPDEHVCICVRNTKDYHYVTVNLFSDSFSKVCLIHAAEPLSGMPLVWECEAQAHCVLEHHRGCLYLFTNTARSTIDSSLDSHYLLRCNVDTAHLRSWEYVFLDDPALTIEDADFCDSHLVLIVKEEQRLRICSVALPLTNYKGPVHLSTLSPQFLPLPDHVCQISAGPNYDYHSSRMRFVVSSPVMPDAVVDYDLSNGNWAIVQQQKILLESRRILYGPSVMTSAFLGKSAEERNLASNNCWNDLSEFYACDTFEVPSDEVIVPLTVVYSRSLKFESSRPGLLHGHGAYGELLDKRWRNELKSLLDRGWVLAYADVRGGGGKGKKWYYEGRRRNKQNSIKDYISCAKFLTEKGIVQENKLAGWGCSAGGLLVAAAINTCTDLFRAAVLKVPFLDPVNSLLCPIIPLLSDDYEEFGYPQDVEDFLAICRYSPYENIQKDALYPAVLVTSSLNTRFGLWEAAKWVAKIRQLSVRDPRYPVLLSLLTDIVEENKYLECKEAALETAFLIKMMDF